MCSTPVEPQQQPCPLDALGASLDADELLDARRRRRARSSSRPRASRARAPAGDCRSIRGSARHDRPRRRDTGRRSCDRRSRRGSARGRSARRSARDGGGRVQRRDLDLARGCHDPCGRRRSGRAAGPARATPLHSRWTRWPFGQSGQSLRPHDREAGMGEHVVKRLRGGPEREVLEAAERVVESELAVEAPRVTGQDDVVGRS